MAHIVYRVTGQDARKRVSRTFRNTKEGREAAGGFAKSLTDAKTVYDVRTRIGGRVVTRTFDRRKDADACVVTTEADKLRGVVIDPRLAQITVGDYAGAWLTKRHDLAQRTAELYEWLLDKHILPTFRTTSLGHLSPSSVRSWHARIAKEHPTTGAKAYRLLSSIMRTAVADEFLARNPCQVKGAAVEKAPERPVPTVAEVQALADAMPDDQRLAVLLAAWCQLRRGELLGLRRRDFDLLRGTLTVALTRVRTMAGKMIDKAPKTEAGRRTIAVPENLAPEIVRHLDDHVGAGPEAPIFEKGYRSLRTAWDNARETVGVTYHLHDLRHAGLTWTAATGATVAELMHRAGHASPMAALRYQHATTDRDRILADALAKLAPTATITPISPARPTPDEAADAVERKGQAQQGS